MSGDKRAVARGRERPRRRDANGSDAGRAREQESECRACETEERSAEMVRIASET